MSKKSAKTKTETHHVECTLTDQEKLVYSKQLAQSISEKNRAEDTLESFRKQQNAVISGHESQINLLSEKLNTGREYRYIECTVEYNFSTSTATITRNDTGEVLLERRITEEERQESLEV